MMMTATTPAAQTPSCWASFTTAASSALTTLAHGVSKLWAMFISGAKAVWAYVSPMLAKGVVWAKANPQIAMIGVGALVAAAGVYFCCYKKAATPAPATPPANPANPPQQPPVKA